jgi:putative transcriptional regulator
LGKNHKKLLNSLDEYRKSAGLTQQELSISAEVSRKSINAIENGIYIPSTVLGLKIAKTINCRVEDLFQLPAEGNTYTSEKLWNKKTSLFK